MNINRALFQIENAFLAEAKDKGLTEELQLIMETARLFGKQQGPEYLTKAPGQRKFQVTLTLTGPAHLKSQTVNEYLLSILESHNILWTNLETRELPPAAKGL